MLSGNCSLLETENVRRQISEHIFVQSGGYCLYMSNALQTKSGVLNDFMLPQYSVVVPPAVIYKVQPLSLEPHLINPVVVNCF